MMVQMCLPASMEKLEPVCASLYNPTEACKPVLGDEDVQTYALAVLDLVPPLPVARGGLLELQKNPSVITEGKLKRLVMSLEAPQTAPGSHKDNLLPCKTCFLLQKTCLLLHLISACFCDAIQAVLVCLAASAKSCAFSCLLHAFWSRHVRVRSYAHACSQSGFGCRWHPGTSWKFTSGQANNPPWCPSQGLLHCPCLTYALNMHVQTASDHMLLDHVSHIHRCCCHPGLPAQLRHRLKYSRCHCSHNNASLAT